MDASSSSSDEGSGNTVPEMHASEEALSLAQRRARYRCGGAFVPLERIQPWSVVCSQPEFQPFFLSEAAAAVRPGVVASAAVNARVCLMRGDITTLEVDAITNAANQSLLGGGGIDGAIHSAAGRGLYRECQLLGGTPTGTTKLTRGYNLPAKFVLHTVGPVGHGEELLASCYRSLLEIVRTTDAIRSVALCGVSTGIFGFDLRTATEIALREARAWLDANPDKVDKLIFCTFLEKELRMYSELFPCYFPVPK